MMNTIKKLILGVLFLGLVASLNAQKKDIQPIFYNSILMVKKKSQKVIKRIPIFTIVKVSFTDEDNNSFTEIGRIIGITKHSILLITKEHYFKINYPFLRSIKIKKLSNKSFGYFEDYEEEKRETYVEYESIEEEIATFFIVTFFKLAAAAVYLVVYHIAKLPLILLTKTYVAEHFSVKPFYSFKLAKKKAFQIRKIPRPDELE